MELLTKIKELAKGKRAAVLTDYTAAVRSVASNKKVDPANVAQVIDAAGKTPEEFEADVKAFARRLQLRATADQMTDAERKLVEAKRQIQALEKRLEDTVAEIRTEAAPHHNTVRDCERTMDAARNAEDELRKSYPADGPARRELADAQDRIRTADAKRRDLKEMIKRAEGTIGLVIAHPARYAADELPNAEKRMAGYREQLTAAEAEYTAAVDAMNTATAKMVQP